MEETVPMNPIERVRQLPIWSGAVDPKPISGGITNVNLMVSDQDKKYLVRIGDDIVVHQVMRFNELAASRAAHAAGLSPAVVHHQQGILVLEFIECHTFSAEDVRKQENLERIVTLIQTCHRDVPKHVRGPVLMFWVFHVVRDYAWTLREGNSSHCNKLDQLLAAADRLEQASSPINVVFGHNDLLAANILDDGSRLWLIDWDYAGFNSPLFDLGGLASNNELSEAQETWLLEAYFEQAITDELLHRYQAMKCASLLRETLWSMVSEIHSKLDFDFAQYTAENHERFVRAYDTFTQT